MIFSEKLNFMSFVNRQELGVQLPPEFIREQNIHSYKRKDLNETYRAVLLQFL